MSCGLCQGTGLVNGEDRFKPCARCGGEGKLRSGGRTGGSFECTSCRGSGQKKAAPEKVKCKRCKGSGRQENPKKTPDKGANDKEEADGARSSGSNKAPKAKGNNKKASKTVDEDDDNNITDEGNDDVEAQTVGKSRSSSTSSPVRTRTTQEGYNTITCTINVAFIGSIFSVVSIAIGLLLVIGTGSSLGIIVLGCVLILAGAIGAYYANKDKCKQAMDVANQM